MAFAVSGGKLQAIERPTAQAPYALRIAGDFTQDYEAIYRSQPAVRMVVDFLARNIGQLALHSFRRLSDTDRVRLTEHPFVQLMARPNGHTTAYRLWSETVADRGIFDRAFWLKTRDGDRDALVRIPSAKVSLGGKEDWLHPEFFEVKGSRGTAQLDPKNVVYFRGYHPTDARGGLSPIESLRRILAEEWAAGQMREQILRNGARTSGYIQRPKDAPDWSDTARRTFKNGWRAQYQGQSASEAGGTPVLEDGMTFVAASQTALDLQYVEARKLTREEVAAAYFIPPPMVGILDHATFGNIEEQHKMLYQDTLGPWLEEFQQEVELQLLPNFPDVERVYVEFNLAAKLAGSFEDQANALTKLTGAPVMTRAEGRARLNLPEIAGADQLVVPLNVLVGGQASPSDSLPKAIGRIPAKAVKAIEARVKSAAAASYSAKAAEVLSSFFARQEAVVKSALGAKADEWWNASRWNAELGGDLFALSATVSAAVAVKQLDELGIDPAEYDADRTLAYLAKVARSNAESINAVTKLDLDAALDAEDPLAEVVHVFDIAKSSRSDQAGLTIVTALAGFASLEAVEQVRGERTATKTWLVTSRNPRSSHAAMNGETVPIDQPFSNGAMWPGDTSALDVAEVAGCQCSLQIDFE